MDYIIIYIPVFVNHDLKQFILTRIYNFRIEKNIESFSKPKYSKTEEDCPI